MTSDVAVRRRLVVVLPGFEAVPPVAHARRFVREAKAACVVYDWDVSSAGDIQEVDSGACAGVRVRHGEIETIAAIYFCDLDGALGPHRDQSLVTRFVSGFGALADFLFSGTVLRYARTSWRFVLFYIFPLFSLLFAGLAGWFGALIGGHLSATFAVAVAALLALTALMVAIWQLQLLLALDLWAFAADVVRGRERRVEPALDRLADVVSRRAAEGSFDEVVIAGHSIGAVPAVSLAARLVRGGACRPHVLTVGSTLLQVALHPSAVACRAEVAEVVRNGLCWLDVQSLTDPINFHRSEPAAALGIAVPGAVRTMSVRFRQQLDPAHYARIKYNPFRVHRQFVLAVERRSAYSFHAILCGPEPFVDVARRPGLRMADVPENGAA